MLLLLAVAAAGAVDDGADDGYGEAMLEPDEIDW